MYLSVSWCEGAYVRDCMGIREGRCAMRTRGRPRVCVFVCLCVCVFMQIGLILMLAA